MTTLEAIHGSVAAEMKLMNERIDGILNTNNDLMNSVVAAQLRSKGKQIRPLVVILSSRLCGDPSDATIAAAAAVELLHNASLIHDDVVDNAATRRKHPTINSIWDNHIAVLVGDYFESCAMQQAVSTADIRVIDALSGLGRLLSLGEIDQIYNARFHTLTEASYYNVIGNKTASFFVACARMGLYTAGINDDDPRLEALSVFAEKLGLCFQIRDDIFDYFSSDAVGKPTNNDLREGKITLPLLHVLLDDSLPAHADMLALARKEMLDPEDIVVLTKFAVDNGGIEYAYAEMDRLRDEARAAIASFPPSEVKSSLLALFDFIISRDH